MDLIYNHPNITAVYTMVLPDNASDEEVREGLLTLARDAHARPRGQDEDWLQQRIDQYSNRPPKRGP